MARAAHPPRRNRATLAALVAAAVVEIGSTGCGVIDSSSFPATTTTTTTTEAADADECTNECRFATDTVAIVELVEPVDPDYPTMVIRADETEIGAAAFDRILASLDRP